MEFCLQVAREDAYNILTMLYQYSTREVGEKLVQLRARRLSLQLLVGVISNCGPAFSGLNEFHSMVKGDIVTSLLKNCDTGDHAVFKLSTELFTTLLSKFKRDLKPVIGVFIDTIFLKILMSPNSSFHHKNLSLEVCGNLCRNPQTVVELFLNYDCDMKAPNIFQVRVVA